MKSARKIICELVRETRMINRGWTPSTSWTLVGFVMVPWPAEPHCPGGGIREKDRPRRKWSSGLSRCHVRRLFIFHMPADWRLGPASHKTGTYLCLRVQTDTHLLRYFDTCSAFRESARLFPIMAPAQKPRGKGNSKLTILVQARGWG